MNYEQVKNRAIKAEEQLESLEELALMQTMQQPSLEEIIDQMLFAY